MQGLHKYKTILFSLAFSSCYLFSQEQAPSSEPIGKPEGWSLDAGGQYTWMSLSTPPSYTGSTGGVNGKITYQKPQAVFGQIRSIYNLGTLSNSLNAANDYEWYSELVGGYCFSPIKNWTITPYIGLGFDFLRDHHKAGSSMQAIQLRYRIYYAVAGFNTRYTWQNWCLGLEADCLPTFDQFLEIKGLTGSAWTLSERVGFDIKLPVGRKVSNHFWLEAAPYYRCLPIGTSSILQLPHRNLDQWGIFAALRFFI